MINAKSKGKTVADVKLICMLVMKVKMGANTRQKEEKKINNNNNNKRRATERIALTINSRPT